MGLQILYRYDHRRRLSDSVSPLPLETNTDHLRQIDGVFHRHLFEQPIRTPCAEHNGCTESNGNLLHFKFIT